MINKEDWKNWDWYKKRLPLYMLNSKGIEDVFYTLFKFLENLDTVEDNISEVFDIMNSNYEDIVKKYDVNGYQGYDFKFLDMLCYIYGTERYLGLEYIDKGNQLTKKNVHLNNGELLLLIKIQIIQMGYDGSYKQLIEFYENSNIKVKVINSDQSAVAQVYFDKDSLSENEQALANAGYLLIQSLGITYYSSVTSLPYLGYWDSESTNLRWEGATWGV